MKMFKMLGISVLVTLLLAALPLTALAQDDGGGDGGNPFGTVLVIVAGLAMVGFLILMVVVGRRENEGYNALNERLQELGERETPESLEEVELSLGVTDRILVPLSKKFAGILVKMTPERQLEDIERLLELANKDQAPSTFFATRIGLTIALGAIMFVVMFVLTKQPVTDALLFTLGGAALGYYLPMMSLKSAIEKRQANIVKALPNALDLLTICVEAGLGFDSAMGKVYEKWDNELAVAFGRVLQELQLGKVRREALRDMADRMDVPDINSFVAAIIQADQLGVSIAKILRIQSDQMRVKRRQRAEEKAHQAPVKMMIPMVLLIFPSLWIVLLGPSVIILMESGIGGMV